MGRIRSLWLLLGLVLFAVSFYDVSADVIPSENECRPYIEKAIHELKNTESIATDDESTEDNITNTGEDTSIETTAEAASEDGDDDGTDDENDNANSLEDAPDEDNQESLEAEADNETTENVDLTVEDNGESQEAETEGDHKTSVEKDGDDGEENAENSEKSGENAEEESVEATAYSTQEDTANDSTEESQKSQEEAEETEKSVEQEAVIDDDSQEQTDDTQEHDDDAQDDEKSEETATAEESAEEATENVTQEEIANDSTEDADNSQEQTEQLDENNAEVEEEEIRVKRSVSDEAETAVDDDGDDDDDSTQDETVNESTEGDAQDKDAEEPSTAEDENSQELAEDVATDGADDLKEQQVDDNESQETADDDVGEKSQEEDQQDDTDEDSKEVDNKTKEVETTEDDNNSPEDAEQDEKSEESMPEEDLTLEFEIPKNLRPRNHINDLLGLDAKSSIKENALKRTGDVILKELKRIYDNAIKPLEQMYKYRDLSNRHFGDPEIFSKPLVLFMGPWSGGKSTILNYLTDNEYTPNSIRSGAEPSPAYFNILMYGDEPEVLDGTQLAADWTFSGLQKFGQGLMDRLRGQKLPSKLLERVNIVEIPGILEVRKQVSRFFPFNDACQWFIDRADIIFLVYDPSKLDVGPETEAILDQLKGREYQTRILLNKGDQVKPEELLRVQSALIWNISPLMSSAQPPVMYTVSLWSHPFEQGAPVRLLQAQERALLSDLREAIDKRIENKIASARRFAVRIRNHAKMVDCYLTTYYNQKSLFSNKKQVSDKIIEHPQNYNIYEGLSTLTNISRYDLPDPEVYLDFFRLNPLYEFKKLSETCTYFKGCPINKLDIAIAYDLPELVGKYKKLMEENYSALLKEFDENCNQTEPEPPVKLR